MHKIKVGLVGYGSQGTRIADAISVQKDMELAGVRLKESDIYALIAFRKGFALYLVDSDYTRGVARLTFTRYVRGANMWKQLMAD